MKINEIFGNTCQGEGPYAGYPATFIRTAGCVAPFCDFCDTKYSWKEGKEMSPYQIVKELLKYKTSRNLIVITGGEPFLQKDLEEVIDCIKNNIAPMYIQIETSGKAGIKNLNTTIICSPKQYNGKFVLKEEDIHNADFYKFVVGNENDLKIVKKFVKKHNLDKKNCYLMPLTKYLKNEDLEIKKLVWKFCYENNFKYSPRIQNDLFGKKRGI
jgi:7-carboxy-7-deazaguanine synthase